MTRRRQGQNHRPRVGAGPARRLPPMTVTPFVPIAARLRWPREKAAWNAG
jgi:hypothetical protein